MTLLTQEGRRFPQIAASINYILDNPSKYLSNKSDRPNHMWNSDIYEFGVYKGESLGLILDDLDDNKIYYNNVFGIDSFEGLPESGSFEKFQEGAYSTEALYGSGYIEELVKNLDISEQDDWDWGKTYFIKSWYNELVLDKFSVKPQPALFVHIDCDLRQSAYDALNFMFKNNLINENTLIAFDEYLLSDQKNHKMIMPDSPCHAWWALVKKYNVNCEEIFHVNYFDKDTGVKIRQNVIAIERIGNASTTNSSG